MDPAASASGGASPPALAAAAGRRRRGRVVIASVAVAALMLLAFWAGQRWLSRQRPAAAPTFTRLTFDRQSIANARLMPDGRGVVFSVSLPDGSASLYTVRPGSAAPQPIGQPRTHLLVAFMDHPARYDDRDFVKVVDRSRAVTTLAGEYPAEQGIAWTPDGSPVVFSAQAPSSDNLSALLYMVLAVRIGSPGQPSAVLTGAGSQSIFDIGRGPGDSWLIGGRQLSSSIMVLTPGQSGEREFVWRHNEWNPSLSSDGRQLMFTDGSAGANYAVAVRTVDDSRVKTLKEGDARGFSPDNRWALAFIPNQSRIVGYPTGTGSPVPLNTGRLEHLGAGESLTWYPDSSAVLACGNEPGRLPHCYRIAMAGGPPEPVTPDGVVGGWVSRDGRILVRRSDGTMAVLSSSNGAPRVVPGITQADAAFGWAADGRSLYGGRPGLPFKLEQIDVETGRRNLLKELAPPDRNGVGMIGMYYMVSVLPNGRGYAYRVDRLADTLYAVTNASALVAR